MASLSAETILGARAGLASASRGSNFMYCLAGGLFVGYVLQVLIDYSVDFAVDVPLRVVGYQREPARANV